MSWALCLWLRPGVPRAHVSAPFFPSKILKEKCTNDSDSTVNDPSTHKALIGVPRVGCQWRKAEGHLNPIMRPHRHSPVSRAPTELNHWQSTYQPLFLRFDSITVNSLNHVSTLCDGEKLSLDIVGDLNSRYVHLWSFEASTQAIQPFGSMTCRMASLGH
jgi:hypothetical protein